MSLLTDFKKKYSTKYTFETDDPLSGGSYGAVFKGFDIDRGIPVAIKIYHDGTVPLGSERGWIVTSKIINPQISPTFTIETFNSDNKECKAVISRFIPGKSLKQIFDWANEQTPKNKLLIADDFVFSLLPSLLNILELCHSLGFGHGDLHSGNIMATLTNINEKFEFTATLIDFDNSSIETNVYCATEKEKIEKDCRSFASANGIGPYTVLDWQWAEQVKNIFTSYNRIRDFKIAFESILNYVDLINREIVTNEKTLIIFKNLLNHSMHSFSSEATMDSLREISKVAGLTTDFEKNYKTFQDMFKKDKNWISEVTIIEHGNIKNSLYNDFFG